VKIRFEDFIDRAAIAIMAGFGADPTTGATEPAALARVAYVWAEALEEEKRKRAAARVKP